MNAGRAIAKTNSPGDAGLALWGLAWLAYLALLSLALFVGNPFATVGEYAGLLRRVYLLYFEPVAHIAAFTPLGFLCAVAPKRLPRLLLWLTALSYALASEAVQSLVPGRTPEWRDLADNLLGLTAGALAFAVFCGIRRP